MPDENLEPTPESPGQTDIGPMPAPFDPTLAPEMLNVGDTVQARRVYDDGTVDSTEGVITAIAGAVVTVGTRDRGFTEGWTFEVTNRVVTLPPGLCEIDAQLFSAPGTHRLMGKGTVWASSDTGVSVPASDIRSFTITT